MKVEGSVKHDHIVEAAIKRFSHFGINKTTLTEIAEDIGISKPSLFYYFQDKNSLLEAVGQKIVNEFLEGYQAVLESAKSVDEGLLNFIEVKKAFYKKYQLLAWQADSIEINKVSPKLSEFIMKAHERTVLMVAGYLKQGIEQQVLRPVDPIKTTRLLLETLQAFDQCIRTRSPLPGSKDIDGLYNKQKEVMQMFLNGLKNNE